MKLLNQKLPKPTFRNTKSVPFEEETIFKLKGPVGMVRTIFKDGLEVFILCIQVFDTLKPKHLRFKSRE